MDEYGEPLILQDFIEDPNLDQFIELIRGENEDPVAGFDYNNLVNGCFPDAPFGSTQENVFDFFNGGGAAASAMVYDDLVDFVLDYSSFPNLNGGMKGEEEGHHHHEKQNDGDDSSGTTTRGRRRRRTTTVTSTCGNKKIDRSRTLISEQTRRGKMKEKLYALRALVPNITKVRTYGK